MTTNNARRLRSNMTDAERRLWRHLRLEQMQGCKFRRQTPIGAYIVDFVSFDAMLVIEVDGGQHADNREADEQRTRYLNQLGYRVIRFWNNQVLQETDAVLETIRRELLVLALPLPQQPLRPNGLSRAGGGAREQAADFEAKAFLISTAAQNRLLPPAGKGWDRGKSNSRPGKAGHGSRPSPHGGRDGDRGDQNTSPSCFSNRPSWTLPHPNLPPQGEGTGDGSPPSPHGGRDGGN